MISAGELASIRADFGDVFLKNTADVYVEDQSSGRFTTVLRTGLACWLANLGTATAQSVEIRDELAARRLFYYDPSYALPSVCEVEVADPAMNGTLQRFNPVTGTEVAQAAPDGTVISRRVDVVRTKA